MKIKIVVPGDEPAQIQGSHHLDRLREHADVVVFTDHPSTIDEQVERARNATCIINSRSRVRWPREALEQLPDLKMITVCGIGTDAIDLEAAREAGIAVYHIPGKTSAIVAEHAYASMLAVAHRAWFQTDALKRGRWLNDQNIGLRNKTLGLVGTGSIGVEMARLSRSLDMKVIAWTFHPTPERARELGLTYVSLTELLETADVVSLHVKLTPDSRGLIGAEELARMKPGAILVNTARGPVVDTAALVNALNSGQLGGAAIDVFDEEPIPADHPLLACDHVVLSPHNADQTPEGIDLLNSWCVDNVLAFLEGRSENRVA